MQLATCSLIEELLSQNEKVAVMLKGVSNFPGGGLLSKTTIAYGSKFKAVRRMRITTFKKDK